MEYIERLAKSFIYTEDLERASIGKRNNGYVIHFYDEYRDDDEISDIVERIKMEIDEIPGYLVSDTASCANTVHIYSIDKILYDENKKNLYLITEESSMIIKDVSEVRARIIRQRIGVNMGIFR